jgi:hypothetical protein
MLRVIFWVVSRRVVFSRRFGTLCLFHLHRRVGTKISYPLAYEDGTDNAPKRRLLNTKRRETTQKITRN